MRKLRPSSLVITAAAASVGAVTALPAWGQTNVFEYRVQTELNSTFDERIAFEYVGPISASVTDATGTASGRADVGVGVNKAFASLRGPAPTSPIETAAVDAFTEWGDVVTISDPVLNGQPGSFTARLRVNGAGSFSMSPVLQNDPDVFLLAHWAAVTNVYAAEPTGTIENQDFGWAGEWFQGFGNPLEYGGDPLNSYQEDFTVNFVYGEPFVMSTFLQTTILYDNINLAPGTIEAELDLGNSAYWGGISVIRNAQGQAVTGAALTSRSGVQWQAEVDPNSFRGDFDDDGNVNLADFNILAANFGRGVAPWQLGDATGDGLVNLADFNRLAQNFGLPAAGTGGPTPDDWAALASAVPEPSSLALLALGAIALTQCRRRRA